MEYKHMVQAVLCGVTGGLSRVFEIPRPKFMDTHLHIDGDYRRVYLAFEISRDALSNTVAREIGIQIAREMRNAGIINEKMTEREIIDTVIRELELCGAYTFQEEENEVKLTISDCKICPPRGGKYNDVVGRSACPFPGMIVGLFWEMGKHSSSARFRGLLPGDICHISLDY